MTEVAKKEVIRLIAEMGSKDAAERRRARASVVQIGSAAVLPLLDALDADQQHLRWEAAKALAEIADPTSAERLVAALGDRDSDVRWVVGEALIRLDREAVKPLLTTLTKSDLADGVYQGAHHVLHDLVQRGDLAALLEPVLKAFDQPEPEIAVPQAAAEALRNCEIQ